jgi:hypothetical protein
MGTEGDKKTKVMELLVDEEFMDSIEHYGYIHVKHGNKVKVLFDQATLSSVYLKDELSKAEKELNKLIKELKNK